MTDFLCLSNAIEFLKGPSFFALFIIASKYCSVTELMKKVTLLGSDVS